MVHLIHHPPERADQNTNLIIGITADRYFPEAEMDLVHIFRQTFQP